MAQLMNFSQNPQLSPKELEEQFAALKKLRLEVQKLELEKAKNDRESEPPPKPPRTHE